MGSAWDLETGIGALRAAAEDGHDAILIDAEAEAVLGHLDEAVALLREVPGAASSQRYVEAWSERARALLSRHDTPTDSEEEG